MNVPLNEGKKKETREKCQQMLRIRYMKALYNIKSYFHFCITVRKH